MPATVPSHAQTVFFSTPPSTAKLTAATYTHSKNVVGSVGAPFISAGNSSQNTPATVKISPIRDFAPVLPPTSTVIRRNSPSTIQTGTVRLYSYTVAFASPFSYVEITSVQPSPTFSGAPYRGET